MLHRGKRGGRGRPPLTRGGGRPLTTGNNNNRSNDEDSSIDTPPRSPSEGSVGSQGATLQQLFGSAIPSPSHSPPPTANNNARIESVSQGLPPSVMLPPAPFKQQLPTSTPLPKAPSAPKVPTPTPSIGANIKQPIAAPPKAANIAGIGPDLQGFENRFLMRIDNLYQSLQQVSESTDALQASCASIRHRMQDHERAIDELFMTNNRQDLSPNHNRPSVVEPRSQSNHSATTLAPTQHRPVPALTRQLPPSQHHQNSAAPPVALINLVLEDKHIPPVIETMSGMTGSKNQTMSEWIENIRIVVTKKNWSDYTARQIFLLRTKGSLYRFLYREINIDTMTLDQILTQIRNRFITADQELIDYAAIRSIVMGDDETVDEYWERFDLIAGRTSKTDFDKMSDFITGLRDDIKDGVINRCPDTLLAAYNAAQRTESWQNAFNDHTEPRKSPLDKSPSNLQQSPDNASFSSTTTYYSPMKTPVF